MTDIPSSFNGTSLFIDKTHIIDADEANDMLIEEMAASTALALNTEVRTIQVSHEQFARAIATQQGNLDELLGAIKDGEPDFDSWTEGYSINELTLVLGN